MGGKSLMAAPLWAASYQIEPAGFGAPSRSIGGKKQILHHQDFAVHISGIPILHRQRTE